MKLLSSHRTRGQQENLLRWPEIELTTTFYLIAGIQQPPLSPLSNQGKK